MSPKTILFLGATGGCGLSALRRSLAAGHVCIALCRTPSKLTSQLPSSSQPPANLHIIQGDAHDESALIRCLTFNTLNPIDTIIFSIGAYPTLTGMADPHVCEKGMRALLAALQTCRHQQTHPNRLLRPRIIALSTTGVSSHGRDLPLPMVIPYKLLATPHKDKKAMEDLLIQSPEGKKENGGWTIIRGSLYTNGPEGGKIRVGVEDPVKGVVESRAVGYRISREDVGRWVFEEVVMRREEGGWRGKAVGITY